MKTKTVHGPAVLMHLFLITAQRHLWLDGPEERRPVGAADSSHGISWLLHLIPPQSHLSLFINIYLFYVWIYLH